MYNRLEVVLDVVLHVLGDVAAVGDVPDPSQWHLGNDNN